MKHTTQTTLEMYKDHSSRTNLFLKSLVTGLLMTAFILWSQSSKAQKTTSTTVTDSTKSEKVEAPKKSWTVMIDPMYSPTDDLGTVRFQWWWSIWDLKVWGFVDFTATNVDDGINTAFGKITVAQPIGKHGTSAAIEYTLHTATQDKVRIWIKQVIKMKDWSVVFKVYPLSGQWFEPYLLVWADYKLGKYFGISAFVGSDIKSKGYYSESEITIGKGKIQGIAQVRVWGTYTTKPKAWAYVWMRIKL